MDYRRVKPLKFETSGRRNPHDRAGSRKWATCFEPSQTGISWYNKTGSWYKDVKSMGLNILLQQPVHIHINTYYIYIYILSLFF
jgi:hypothetical protein